MFDFEKLEVYQKAKIYNKNIRSLIQKIDLDSSSKNQLRRAAFSISLNIAEGSGRFTKRDKRNFYVISRGSVFECVSLLDFLNDEGIISNTAFQNFYRDSEELSKMLFAMIKRLE